MSEPFYLTAEEAHATRAALVITYRKSVNSRNRDISIHGADLHAHRDIRIAMLRSAFVALGGDPAELAPRRTPRRYG